MIKIDIDYEVFEKIKEIAIPFVEITPNMVIRRLLGMSNKELVEAKFASATDGASRDKEAPTSGDVVHSQIDNNKKISESSATVNSDTKDLANKDYLYLEKIERLQHASIDTHSAFLTFLMDKYFNSNGNYKTKQIYEFMENVYLKSISDRLRNPWMNKPYKNKTSCLRTIEHFKQTRKFGCWYGRNIKTNCDAVNECSYHPESGAPGKNKCDLRKGVIWKRKDPTSAFQYGLNYIEVVKTQLLNNKHMPMEPLLNVFYPQKKYTEELIDKFQSEFHFSDEEMNVLFEI